VGLFHLLGHHIFSSDGGPGVDHHALHYLFRPGLDAGYDPHGLAVDDDAIYVSAYRSDSLGVRRGPCRVIRIDLETGRSTGYVDVPSPCGHAGGLAVGGDGMLYVAEAMRAPSRRRRLCPGAVDDGRHRGMRPRKSGSHRTRRWRKADSNSWSHLWMRVSLGATGRK
jgi:hypothetical protein